ncbi:MAG: nitroreductase family protein [Thermoplasmatota archaeon]
MNDPVLSRRSIRSYKDREIDKEAMEYILTAGDAAACARGKRSWHFIVIQDRELLDRIPLFHPYSKMIREAPAAVLVCALPSVESDEGYRVQNCSAATQNMLIAANLKGIGSVWLGVYPNSERMEGMKELLGLSDEKVPFSLIVLGHPNEEKSPYTHYDPKRVSFVGP